MRDDFSSTTRDMLGRRVGFRCSNPDCGKPTSGPQEDPQKAINIGVAAHICAAAPGGKRYEAMQSAEERSGIENGIWLCQNCAKLIDSDESRYSPEILKKWKSKSETASLLELERRNNSILVEEKDHIAIQKQQLRAFYRPLLSIYNGAIQTDTITIVYLQNQGYFARSLSVMFPLVDRTIEKMFSDKNELDTDEVVRITFVGNLLRPIIPIRVAISFIDITGRIYQQEYQKIGAKETITKPALIDTLKKIANDAG